MRPIVLRAAILGALLLATLVSGQATACGWYQTCETEAWLQETVDDLMP